MHARIVSGQFQPDGMEEAVGIYRDSIAPAAREQQGNKGGYLLTDSATGKFVSISLWETEADMQASETGGYLKEQIAKAAPTFAGPPTSEHFVVSVQI